MPTLDELLKQIEGQQETISGMGKTIGEMPVGFEYEEAIRGRLKPDEELIKSIAASRAKMLAIPSEVRARQKPGWVTPTQTAGLIAGEQEPVRAQWETLMQLRQAKEGRIEDIIGRVTKMIDTDIQKQKAKYDQAVDELKMSVDMRNWLAGQEKEKTEQAQYAAEQAESKRRWEAEFAKPPTYAPPSSYQEWQYAGGEKGTGMSYAEWLTREEFTVPQQKAISEAQYNIGELDQAIKWLEEGKVKTGPAVSLQRIAGRKIPEGIRPWYVSPEQMEFEDILNRMRAEEFFTVGGKALTATEKPELVKYITGLSDQEDYVLNNLKKFRDSLKATSLYSSLLETEQPKEGAGDLRTQVINKGYDYDQMKADGYSDDAIRISIGL